MAKMPMAFKGAMKKFEGSKKDMAMDKKGAKKAGMPMKSYEGSPMDMKADRAGAMSMPAMKKGGMVKRGKY